MRCLAFIFFVGALAGCSAPIRPPADVFGSEVGGVELELPLQKRKLDALVPIAAARAELDVEENPGNSSAPWILTRGRRADASAFSLRLDTIAHDDRTKLSLSTLEVDDAGRASAEAAAAKLGIALTLLARGVVSP